MKKENTVLSPEQTEQNNLKKEKVSGIVAIASAAVAVGCLILGKLTDFATTAFFVSGALGLVAAYGANEYRVDKKREREHNDYLKTAFVETNKTENLGKEKAE